MEHRSGISHIFNLSNFEFLGFQILVIWDLQVINIHATVVLALIFHLGFKLLSALYDSQTLVIFTGNGGAISCKNDEALIQLINALQLENAALKTYFTKNNININNGDTEANAAIIVSLLLLEHLSTDLIRSYTVY